MCVVNNHMCQPWVGHTCKTGNMSPGRHVDANVNAGRETVSVTKELYTVRDTARYVERVNCSRPLE